MVHQGVNQREVISYQVFKTQKVDDEDTTSLQQDLHGAGKYMVLSTCGPIGRADRRREIHAKQLLAVQYDYEAAIE